MDLKTYLESSPRGTAAALALRIEVHPVMVSQWSVGRKPVPLDRCVAIELGTARAVRRWDLRPTDWHRIWPELIGADGAPPVPETPTIEETRNAA